MSTTNNLNGLFITGTDTGVGKTAVAGAIATYLRGQGGSVGVMKPVETGCRTGKGGLVPADAVFLRRVSGTDDVAGAVCPYRFAEPLAPWIAAKRAGKKINTRLIVKICRAIAAGHDMTVVEGAGGMMVPLDEKYLFLDLAAELGFPVVIVGRAGLGAINHTLLTVKAARERNIEISGIILNHDRRGPGGAAESTNPEAIRELSGVARVFSMQYMPGIKRSAKALDDAGKDLARQGFFGLTKK
ncbi:MAG: dethiobiotin synthase [Nitrospirae bacterium]|nr:dethiobiotin synthase [Nitrospirota bacterium]